MPEPGNKKRVTLEDLAQAAGISRSAASKAMRNHPEISKATREKIHKLAEKMGYVRDPSLSRLAKYRWDATEKASADPIAFIYPFGSDHAYDQTFHDSFKTVAAQNGFRLHSFYAEDYTPERLRKIVYARGIRGLVFQRIVDPAYIHSLMTSEFVCVSIGEGKVLPPCEMIRSDYLWCLTDAIHRHRETGRKKLALVLREGMRKNHLTRHLEALWRYEGFPENTVVYYQSHEHAPFEEWLKKNRPDGLVSFLWNPVPEIQGQAPPQIVLRLFGDSLRRGNGYYLSEERLAARALHHLESRLVQIQKIPLYGTTLMRPEWVDPPGKSAR